MTTNGTPPSDEPSQPLPADDPTLLEADLAELERRWASSSDRLAISAETMSGCDRRAQALGVPSGRLMEHAGTAVAAAARAVLVASGRLESGPVLVLCGPGNNGGDGFVAARRLARAGLPVIAVLVGSEARPRSPDAAKNWDRLAAEPLVTRLHVSTSRDLQILRGDVDRAGLVVDALLGSGAQGVLRDPIGSAVEVIRAARAIKVPVVAVDTPTGVDMTSGEPSTPVAGADLTITFHRPKTGFLTRRGAAFAGRVLVAPIGIPAQADRV